MKYKRGDVVWATGQGVFLDGGCGDEQRSQQQIGVVVSATTDAFSRVTDDGTKVLLHAACVHLTSGDSSWFYLENLRKAGDK